MSEDYVEGYEGDLEPFIPYAGIATFMRAEHTRDVTGADIVVIGNPFDAGTSNHPGAREGPRALRDQSLQVCSYGKVYPWDYDIRERCKIIDYGDVLGDRIGAGATLAMVEAMRAACKKAYDAGASVLVLGGDHTDPYGPMPEAAAKYGKLSMIHFDSHQDASKTGPDHFHHGSFAWDMVKTGIVDDARSAQLYIRTFAPDQAALDYNIVYANDALAMGPEALAEKVRAIVGENPVFITFDIDCLDPAYAPATGTPVCGGPSLQEVRRVLWGLRGLNVVGADLVEVSPAYDPPNQMTALAGATIAADFLYLMGEARQLFRGQQTL